MFQTAGLIPALSTLVSSLVLFDFQWQLSYQYLINGLFVSFSCLKKKEGNKHGNKGIKDGIKDRNKDRNKDEINAFTKRIMQLNGS